jgi:hypothetical protein
MTAMITETKNVIVFGAESSSAMVSFPCLVSRNGFLQGAYWISSYANLLPVTGM